MWCIKPVTANTHSVWQFEWHPCTPAHTLPPAAAFGVWLPALHSRAGFFSQDWVLLPDAYCACEEMAARYCVLCGEASPSRSCLLQQLMSLNLILLPAVPNLDSEFTPLKCNPFLWVWYMFLIMCQVSQTRSLKASCFFSSSYAPESSYH